MSAVVASAAASGPPVTAAVLAGCATWLAMAARPVAAARGIGSGRSGRRVSGLGWVAVAVAGGCLMALADGTTLALGLVCLAAVTGAGRLAGRHRARREADRRADRVLEVSEALAGELRAGQPPLSALTHCVEVWPELAPVATAGGLGADVAAALRRLADRRGAEALREVAAAWQVSESSGATMSVALGRVADSIRRDRATQRQIATELASAQATARLVAVLPLVVLGLGSGLGADPWGFLLLSPGGIACLAAGVVLTFAGLTWIDRIATPGHDS